MTFGHDDAERAHLLPLELETSWVLDHDGRIVRSTAPVVPHEPLLVIAAHPAAQVWAASARVPAGSVDDLAVVIAKGERRDLVGWAPAGATEILETLRGAGLGQIAAPMGGLSWLVRPSRSRARVHAELRTSDDLDLDSGVDQQIADDRRAGRRL